MFLINLSKSGNINKPLLSLIFVIDVNSIFVKEQIKKTRSYHHVFPQSTSNSHVQQCNIVEQDSKVQERTLTAARKRSMI